MLAKESLANFPILVAPDFSRPFLLTADASNVGAGAVLMQEDSQELEYLDSYFSKMFTAPQKKLFNHRKGTPSIDPRSATFFWPLCDSLYRLPSPGVPLQPDKESATDALIFVLSISNIS